MTSEHRILIEVQDIIGIEFECPHCRARVRYDLERTVTRNVSRCPNCNEDFYQLQTAEDSDVKRLIGALKMGRAMPGVKAKIRLELKSILPLQTAS
jgi:Zn finger protein HypA/HybF involved in hydrogenase expression